MKRKITPQKLIVISAVFFAVVMVLFPHVTEQSAKAAMIIWANSIVPILLPFFILADFIKQTGNIEKLPAGLYAFAIAVLSGYPMGAKAAGDLISDDVVSLERGKHILSYSLVTGPAFLVGTTGTFLGSTKAGVIVAVSHYLGAVANSFLYSDDKHHQERKPRIQIKNNVDKSYLESFTASIFSGFKAMAIILAYIIIFMIAMDLMDFAGVFGLLNNETAVGTIKGLLEMTVGTNIVGASNATLQIKTVLASFIVSFGGFSVIGQSVSVSGRCGITLTDILKIKLTHGIIAGIIATLSVSFVIL